MCRWSGPSSTTASTAPGSRRPRTVSTRSPSAARPRQAPSEAACFDAARRAPLLRRIAERTEGRFFRADETGSLVDAITYSGKGITVVEERDLWDMPVLLLLMLTFMGGEWLFRRSRGLA